MDTLFGFVGQDFVIVAADMSAARSVVRFKDDEDKIMVIDNSTLLASAGENGDRNQFCEYIQKNLHLYELRTGIPLSTKAAAHYTRGELAKFLRQSPYNVNLLMGGTDKDEGPKLYYLDYLASMIETTKAAHGYGSYFLLSTMDRHWKPNMTYEEALQLVQLCINEIKTRFLMNQPNFLVKIVDQNGVRVIS
eukprot:GILJ01001184.1.p1 GENE.GILJ01001184.1~~GILJ01001184.1.p1  ORF type:complete len:206 (+),score=31.15 GILJ01001184.1:45-620(+)